MKLLIYLAALFVFVACQTTPPKSVVAPKTGPTQVGTAVPTEPLPVPTAPPLPEEPAAKEAPKFGIILGPGGVKSFAHIGVLREFEKMRIKPHAIVGLEWGALVGAIYSVKGLANDTEWQMLKLREENLPTRSFLKGKLESADVKRLGGFLDEAFNGRRVEEGAIRFLCPSVQAGDGRVAWWGLGHYKDAVSKCIPSAPLYEPYESNFAGAFELEEAIAKLKQVGCNVIILVDVVAKGNFLRDGVFKDQSISQQLWWSGLARLRSGSKSLDWVVGVHTRDYHLADLPAARSLIVFGQEAGEKAAKMISDKYGL